MKANEAPENIYFEVNNNLIGLYDSAILGMFSAKNTETAIEYTRTDAFIEKAADYIKKDMLDNLAFQGRLNRIEIIDGIIEKFIKAIKDVKED